MNYNDDDGNTHNILSSERLSGNKVLLLFLQQNVFRILAEAQNSFLNEASMLSPLLSTPSLLLIAMHLCNTGNHFQRY